MGTTRRMLGQTKRQLLTETHCYEVCFPFLSFVVGPLPYLHPSPLHLSIYLSIYTPPPPPPLHHVLPPPPTPPSTPTPAGGGGGSSSSSAPRDGRVRKGAAAW